MSLITKRDGCAVKNATFRKLSYNLVIWLLQFFAETTMAKPIYQTIKITDEGWKNWKF